MPGRPIPPESSFRRPGAPFTDPLSARRREVLRQTVHALETAEPPDRYHTLAHANLVRWRREAETPARRVIILPGDWGEVTLALTRRHGTCFSVLNMANAFVPGGAYVEGAPAQEENMFRRTDCHFTIDAGEYDSDLDRYRPHMTRLLSAADGVVYLDTDNPRICLRGAEDRAHPDLGYRWLAPDEIFPFYELRAAARDLRDGSPFDPAEARRRIAAQLDTLTRHGVRHAVLSAFGCGAFRNPAAEVARLYREAIEQRAGQFDLIAFAIFHPGYGPDNYTPFKEAFSNAPR